MLFTCWLFSIPLRTVQVNTIIHLLVLSLVNFPFLQSITNSLSELRFLPARTRIMICVKKSTQRGWRIVTFSFSGTTLTVTNNKHISYNDVILSLLFEGHQFISFTVMCHPLKIKLFVIMNIIIIIIIIIKRWQAVRYWPFYQPEWSAEEPCVSCSNHH